MTINNLPSWESELIATGHIVQDGDNSVPQEERETRFNRYIALVDAVKGNEGLEAARALVRSIQSRYDYGAYQNTINKLLFSFPPKQAAEAIIAEVPRLIALLPDWAGDILSSITQAQGVSVKLTAEFNSALKQCSVNDRKTIVEFIKKQEAEGWLEHKRGVLGA